MKMYSICQERHPKTLPDADLSGHLQSLFINKSQFFQDKQAESVNGNDCRRQPVPSLDRLHKSRNDERGE